MDKNFTAVVLAADRKAKDEVAEAAGATCKAMSEVGGEPMILRVLRSLEQSTDVGEKIICGPTREILAGSPSLQDLVSTGSVKWLPPASTPSTSAHAALSTLPDDQPVLVTTADHALLTSEMVTHFCATARRSESDLAFAVASHSLVDSAYPRVRRTVLKFREGGFCSCNLFAFMTHDSRGVAEYWRQVEQERKQPWKIARHIGWTTLLRYLLGRLSLDDVLKLASELLGVRVGAVTMPFPQAAIDVDTVADWQFVNRIVEETRMAAAPDETEGKSADARAPDTR